MADFDAGSIVGSLDINLDPFDQGLARAIRSAQEFETRNNPTITPDVDTVEADAELDKLQMKLDDLDSNEAVVRVAIGDEQFEAERAKIQEQVDRLKSDSASIKVKVDTGDDMAKLAALREAADHASGDSGGEAGGGHGMLGLLGAAAALAPALAPAAAAVAGFGITAYAGAAMAAVGIGAFAKVAGSDLTDVQTAYTNLQNAQAAVAAAKTPQQMAAALQQLAAAEKGLKGPMGEAVKAYGDFEGAWAKLKKTTSGDVLGVEAQAMETFSKFLPKLAPLIDSVAKALGPAVSMLGKFLNSSQVEGFLKMLSNNAGPDIKALATVVTNLLSGILTILTALNPYIQAFVGKLQAMSGGFKGVANSLAHGGIQDFFGFIKQYAPQTETLFHNLLGVIMNLAKGLAPLIGPALTFLDDLSGALAHINIKPLSGAIGSLLTALGPVMTMLGNLINVILPPLSTVIKTVVSAGVLPLVASLGKELTPVLKTVGGFLEALAKPLGVLLTSITNLVNPTGIKLFSGLLTDVLNAVTPLIPVVFQLATTLEGLVDDALNALLPLLPTLGGILKDLASDLAPLIKFASDLAGALAVGLTGAIKILEPVLKFLMDGLATLLKCKPLVDIILSLVAAWKLWTIALGIWDAVADAGPMVILVAIGVAILALVEGIKELITHWQDVTQFFENIGSDIAGFFTGAAKWLVNIGKDVIHGLVTGIEWYWNNILKPFYVDMPKKILGWLASAATWLLNTGKHVISGLWSGIKDAWTTVENFFRSMGTTVKNWLMTAIDWLYSTGEDIIRGIWQGIKNAWTTVENFFRNIGSDVKNWLADAGQWLYDAGMAVIQGFWNGLKSIWDDVKGWISSAFGGIKSIVKGVLGIFSPSRVMADLGTSTMQGFHQGFQGYFEQQFAPYVKTAMASISDMATTDLSSNTRMQSQVTASFEASSSMNNLVATLTAQVAELQTQQKNLPDTIESAFKKAINTQTAALEKSNRTVTETQSKNIEKSFKKAQDSSTDKIIRAVRKS